MKWWMRDLVWKRKEIFKGLGCIESVKHRKVLKEGAIIMLRPA